MSRSASNRILLSVLIILISSGTHARSESFAENPSYRPGEILVRFKPGISPGEADRFLARMRTSVVRRSSLTGIHLIALPVGQSVPEAVVLFQTDSTVLYAQPNYVRRVFVEPGDEFFSRQWELHNVVEPNDDFFKRQWGLHNVGQLIDGTNPPVTGLADVDIDAPEAWEITKGNSSVIVAVIDTGVDYNHPDLLANMWANNIEEVGDANGDGFPGVAGIDDDEDGLVDEDSAGRQPGDPDYSNDLKDDDDENDLVDDLMGWNFNDGANKNCSDTASDPMDDFGHGTHVAGVIGAQGNNAVGIAGVMWNVQIMPIKALDCEGSGDDATIGAAIEYAVLEGARIINASFGGPGFSQALEDAVVEANSRGVVFVAAAGNSLNGSDNDEFPIYPAGLRLPNVIAVAASTPGGGLASFSHFGRSSVHLAAPGDCVFSTMPMDPAAFALASNTIFNPNACTKMNHAPNYDFLSGTSMAAPHVSGVAGLLLSRTPTLSPEEVRTILILTAEARDELKGRVASSGMVNALNALRGIKGTGLIGGGGGCGSPFGVVNGDPPESFPPLEATLFLLTLLGPLLLLWLWRRRRLGRFALLARPDRPGRAAILGLWIGGLILFAPSEGTAQSRMKLRSDPPEESRPYESVHSLGIKLGYHRYDDSDYFKTNKGLIRRNDLSGLSGELEYDWRWLERKSLSVTVGHYRKETDNKNVCCLTTGFKTTYLLLTPKFYNDLRPLKWYIGGGIGFYRFEREITGLIEDQLSANLVGIHGVLGLSWAFHPKYSFFTEARYALAKVRSADPFNDGLDVGGFNYALGVSWNFRGAERIP